jgi:hypothetical protein
MSLGLDLTDDEMRRVMECREKWSDDEAIERAAGICVRAMVESFALLAERARRDELRKHRSDTRRKQARSASNGQR